MQHKIKSATDEKTDTEVSLTVVENYRRAVERRALWESLWGFSCWNRGDPNRAKLLMLKKQPVTDRTTGKRLKNTNQAFMSCLRVARRAMAGTLKDNTHGATHYHHKDINPTWSRGRTPCAEIGAHYFYNNVE